MQACNLTQIIRLTVAVLAASVLLTECAAANETQESVDGVSNVFDGSENDTDFVRYYNVTIVNRERLIAFAALALFALLAAVITIRFARNRRSESSKNGTDR